ncbi:unnamed protein product [Dovyalis caffra]|uniref:LOB domain-containing protein n=1 Tax=Dovyalis caffra TaxID=77055 RepID=A0AAV1QSU1_9ROSI|nr:unnamed protein product [Dovyalis caffra]
MLRHLRDDQKEEAMRSVKYQSNMRARFPVHGCLEIIWQLNYHLRQTIEELHYVNAQLAIFYDHKSPNYSEFSVAECDYDQHHLGINSMPQSDQFLQEHPIQQQEEMQISIYDCDNMIFDTIADDKQSRRQDSKPRYALSSRTT